MYMPVAAPTSTMPVAANPMRTASRCGRRQDRQHRVERRSEHDDVADRADARPLAQRDPGQQDDRADRDHDDAERHVQMARDALVEHVPRVEAETGANLKRRAGAIGDQPDVELDEPPAQLRTQLTGQPRAMPIRVTRPVWTAIGPTTVANCAILA